MAICICLGRCREMSSRQNLENIKMKISKAELKTIILEEIDSILNERCQKGYKTHHKRKTKKMYGKTYRNCVKAESLDEELEEDRKKCSACGRSTAKGGSKRKRYPACRPTPSACGKKGKWGKKSKAEKKRKKK